MSMECKGSNGTELKFPSHKSTIRCIADAILQGYADEDIFVKHSLESKHYKSFLEYCTDIADKLPQRQAFYTIDFEDVLWKVQEWKKHLPKVEIFYAVRMNTNPILIQLLTKLGLSFNCASEEEMKIVLKAGCSAKDIIFSHPIKSVEELKFASDKGVETMTFDNEDELLKIHKVFPHAKLLIRIIPIKVNCSCNVIEKFGCTEEESIKLLNLAYKLQLNIIGISFDVGTSCTNSFCSCYTATIERSKRLFDKARDIGLSFAVLDIGGSFFGAMDSQNNFYMMASSLNKALEEHFYGSQVKIFAEFGTYIIYSAISLVSTIIGRRCVEKTGENKSERHYYLNYGIYDPFFKGIHCYGMKPVLILAESEIQTRPQYVSRMYGQTWNSDDVIIQSVVLPELKIGERIIWHKIGAYYLSINSTFNGVPLPVPKYVFVQKQRLNMGWIADKKNITNFLQQYASFIGCTSNDI